MSEENKNVFSADDFSADDFGGMPQQTTSQGQQAGTQGNGMSFGTNQNLNQQFNNFSSNGQTPNMNQVQQQNSVQIPQQNVPNVGGPNNRKNKKDDGKQQIKKVQRTGTETEIRQVDPTKNKKLKERQKKAKNSTQIGGRRIPKVVMFGGIAVLVILVFIGIKAVSGLIGGGSKDTNFFTILDTILQTEQGAFTYVIDVKTGPVEMTTTTAESTKDDLENIESVESDSAAPTIVTKNTFKEWTNAEGIKMTSWEYPKYKITIDGVCTSVDPYEAIIKVDLATEFYNDRLTQLIVKDGKYYLDISLLRNWLLNSQDSYLKALGTEIPEGAKYVAVPMENYKVASRYAEDYEVTASSASSFRQGLLRKLTLENMIEQALVSSINSKCYSVSTADGLETYSVNFGKTNGLEVAKKFRSLVLGASSAYDQYIDLLSNKGLLADTDNVKQIAQKKNEKDNFLYAINPLQIYFNTHSIDDCNFQLVGGAKKYNTIQGIFTAEANMKLQFQSDTKTYLISGSFIRKGGSASIDIEPGTSMELSSLPYETLVTDKINGLIDYLNPTCFELSKQLEMNPDRIADSIKQSLVSVVNSVETTGVYLTSLTVDDYIAKYANMNEELASEQDRINITIVRDFMDTVNSVTGGVYIEVPVEVEEEYIQYPQLVYEDSDMKIYGQFNKDMSDKDLYVVNTTIMNKSENEIVLNLTNFSLKTLLNSKYPSNNLTRLRDYDNSWDTTLTPDSIVLEPSSYANVDLYFVVSGDSGYMDLWYQNEQSNIKLGVIANN